MSGKWTMPFVMQSINTRVVRRSAALLDGAYGAASLRLLGPAWRADAAKPQPPVFSFTCALMALS